MHVCMVVFTELSSDFRVFRAATCLTEAGHRISIVAGSAEPGTLSPDWDRFDVHPIPVDRNGSLRLVYPKFWRQARREMIALHAHAYHAHDLDTLWPAAKAAARCDAALIYDSHELWTEQSAVTSRPAIRLLWNSLEARLIKRADAVIAVSPSIGRELEAQYKLAQAVAVVRNVPPFRPRVDGNRIRSELGVDAARPILLYQGGFLTDNGLAEQIAAMRFVREGVLVLLGGGPTEGLLRKQVSDSGLGDRVYFVPKVPFHALHEYTCSADIGLCLIKPSGRSFELSLPNKLFEYFMAGLPVLGSAGPEIRAIIEETGAGDVVTDVVDPEGIGRSIEQLIADASRRHSYRQAALSAAKQYNWEREAPRLSQVYESL